MKKAQLSVYFDPALLAALEELAIRRRVSRSGIVEAALASFLSPDGADRAEAALIRRLDRQARLLERLERNQEIAIEAQALFVRYWLTAIPPLPEELRAAAQARAKDRYEAYVEALMRKLASGRTLAKEVSRETRAGGGDEDAAGTGGSPGPGPMRPGSD